MKSKLLILCTLVAVTIFTACSQKGGKMHQPNITLDFDTLWQFNKPAETRTKFEDLLLESFKKGDKSYHLQLVTQLARTYSLEGNFDKAHELLNEIEQEGIDTLPLVKVRYLLERGRTYRSAKEVEKSIPLFEEAWNLANDLGEDFFAIDAAHMMAIAVDGFDNRMKWSLLALDKAENSTSERAQKWKGSLYNNIGWDYHDNKQYEKALELFQKAQSFREKQGSEMETRIAKWCVARCLRSLERYDEALDIQQDLQNSYNNSGENRGYNYEELGELYLIKSDTALAEKNFATAYEYLSKDNWMMENEVERMERIKKLGKVQ